MQRNFVAIMLLMLVSAITVQAQIPTRSEFIAACDSLGVRHPNVVWAQARLESGNFKSQTYKSKKNCLGIYDSRRKRYAYFSCWQDCLKAYRDRVQYRFKQTEATDEEYLYWLTKIGYASEKTYASRVRKIMWDVN